MDAINAFHEVFNESPLSADVMRWTCFLEPNQIPFEYFILGSKAACPELATLLESSDDTRAALLSVLQPLESKGLIRINTENDMCSTTPQIQQELLGEKALWGE